MISWLTFQFEMSVSDFQSRLFSFDQFKNVREELLQLLKRIKAEQQDGNILKKKKRYQPYFEVVHSFDERFNHSSLDFAVKNNDVDMVRALLELGVDPNKYKVTPPLVYACGWSDFAINPEIIKLLLEYGAKQELIAESCGLHAINIPLNIMPRNKKENIISPESDVRQTIELLLQYGADINCITDYGETPLISSCMACSVDTFYFLVDKGATFGLSDKTTELLVACSYDNTDVAKYILQHFSPEKVRINFQDAQEDDVGIKKLTALHFAAMNDNPSLFEWLILHGADATLQDEKGRNPYWYVKTRKGKIYQVIVSGYGLEWLEANADPHPKTTISNVNHQYSTSCSVCGDDWVAPQVIITSNGARMYCFDCIQKWIQTCKTNNLDLLDPNTRLPILAGPYSFFN